MRALLRRTLPCLLLTAAPGVPAPFAPGSAVPVLQERSCRPSGPARSLPPELRETSGLARGHRDPKILWTHNDSGNEPVLFALNLEGKIVGKARVQGAQLNDWEDIQAGPCRGGSCLYIADIGDNARKRAHVSVYVVPEPDISATQTATAAEYRARFPDGAQDAEAMFRLPSDGDWFLISKGRHAGIALYRWRSPAPGANVATLERIRELWVKPKNQRDWVTSANATPDGKWVAIRTYRTLFLYPAAQLIGGDEVTPTTFDLAPLGEVQGEAVAVDDRGTVWLTSEAEKKKDLPTLSRLECNLASGPTGPGA
jgi:hypothetical protein